MALFTDIPESQSDALEAFRDATTGASWTNSAGWYVGDGTYDGTAASAHGVTVAGGVVTAVDLNTNNLNGAVSATFIDALPNMTEFRAYTNANFNLTMSISDNSTLTFLQVYSTSSNITGSISLNSTLTFLHVGSTSSNITGSISENSTLTLLSVRDTASTITGSISDNSTLTLLHVFITSSNITGGSATLASYAYREIRLDNNAMTSPEVNDIIETIYRLRTLFTWATPELYIGGDNGPPAGLYRAMTTPRSPREKLYTLAEGQPGETFNQWVITYTETALEYPFILTEGGEVLTAGDLPLKSPLVVSTPTAGYRFQYATKGGKRIKIDGKSVVEEVAI